MTPRSAPRLRAILLVLAAALAVLLPSGAAAAHGFTAAVYASLTDGADPDEVRADLRLEYVLTVMSVAKAEGVGLLESDARSAFATTGADAAILTDYEAPILAYLDEHFGIARDGEACDARLAAPFSIVDIDAVPHALVQLEFDCAATTGSESDFTVTSTLFAPEEGIVTHTETVLDYDLAGVVGSAVLDSADHPTTTTSGLDASSLWEFFVLGAEHLLFGIDHVLFLLALIVGSRRLRDIVLAATAFTVAHSVTFILAALGAISIPPEIAEPIIAISIAVVGAWFVVGVLLDRRRRRRGEDDAEAAAHWTRSAWVRVGVVFLFGLIHGVGFAGALGIDEPFSWGLLGALLVFNLGIEVVQIAAILLIFPLLALVRRRWPRVGLWIAIVVSLVVTALGLYWFVERVLGVG